MNHDGSSFFRFVQRPLGGIPHFRHIMTHPNGMMQVSTNGMMLKGSGKLAMEPWFLSLLHSGYIAGLSPWTPWIAGGWSWLWQNRSNPTSCHSVLEPVPFHPAQLDHGPSQLWGKCVASHFKGTCAKKPQSLLSLLFKNYYSFKGSHVKNLCTIVCYSLSVSSQHVPFSHLFGGSNFLLHHSAISPYPGLGRTCSLANKGRAVENDYM